MYVYMYICMYVYMYVYMYVCIYVCMYVRMYEFVLPKGDGTHLFQSREKLLIPFYFFHADPVFKVDISRTEISVNSECKPICCTSADYLFFIILITTSICCQTKLPVYSVRYSTVL